MEAYSMDLRERVVKACDESNLKRKEIAKRFSVSTAWIRRLLQRRRATGSIAPLPSRRGRKPVLDEALRKQLGQLVAEQPDSTLAELRAKLGLEVSLSVIWRALV